MAGRETDEADRETDVAGMRDRCSRHEGQMWQAERRQMWQA